MVNVINPARIVLGGAIAIVATARSFSDRYDADDRMVPRSRTTG